MKNYSGERKKWVGQNGSRAMKHRMGKNISIRCLERINSWALPASPASGPGLTSAETAGHEAYTFTSRG